MPRQSTDYAQLRHLDLQRHHVQHLVQSTDADGRSHDDAILLVMKKLTIAAGATLRLTGTKPVILAIYGDASIQGTIDVSAQGSNPVPGGNQTCGNAAGHNGDDDTGDDRGGGGGGGGGFGASGGNGGAGSRILGSTNGGGLAPRASASLSPLVGGCAGGAGGVGFEMH